MCIFLYIEKYENVRKNNKFKISRPQLIKKHGEKTDNPLIRIYVKNSN